MGRFKTKEEKEMLRMRKNPTLGNLAATDTVEVKPITSPVEPTTEEKDLIKKGAEEERQRILALVFNNKELMTAEFKVLMKHTGGYLNSSMAVAYSRGFNDIIKLILNEGKKDEKPVQKEG